MKKIKVLLMSILAILAVVGLTACGSKQSSDDEKNDSNNKLAIVTTNSILGDMVENVGGDKVDIHSVVPRGTDPHEYEPLPEDIAKTTDADIIFYNGLNLETGGGGWFAKLMKTTKKEEDKDYFMTSKNVEPLYLTGKGQESEQDPHAWLSLANGMTYVDNIKNVLIEKDPDNKDYYEKNAENYTKEIKALHEKNLDRFNDIPENKKLLVTSEGAFKYFSKAYGIPAAYIWEINTESQGTPDQMSQIIDKIKQSDVQSLFVEQSVDPRSMETVSRETGIPIYDTVFTDSLAKEGTTGDNYIDMLTWNFDTIYDGLMK